MKVNTRDHLSHLMFRCYFQLTSTMICRRKKKKKKNYDSTVSQKIWLEFEFALLTHLCLMSPASLGRSMSNSRFVRFVLLLSFLEIHVPNANSVDPDQTPRCAASDLGLYCLPMSILWGTRHKWFKICGEMHPFALYLQTIEQIKTLTLTFSQSVYV